MIGYISFDDSHIFNNKPRPKDCGTRPDTYNICSDI